MIIDRAIEILKSANLTGKELEERTCIDRYKWNNLKAKRQRLNDDFLEEIVRLWPQYSYWLMTGKTIPEAGQTSPELEETRRAG